MYRYLDKHNFLNPNQSGFRSKDLRVYQLTEITHNIFSSFDCNSILESRAIFLYILKAFDKLWHKGLLFKLEPMGISDDLLNLMESCFSKRFQIVLLNGQLCVWASTKAGVAQGSIIAPFFS